ncbi:MAG: hypothetical protein WCB27_26090 [Thermoguttaceae bacterium]|jgi:hypothetical protein
MVDTSEVKYFTDLAGNLLGVVVPMAIWREIEAEIETAHLLKSETMRHRLLEAKDRRQGISLHEARGKLGI